MLLPLGLDFVTRYSTSLMQSTPSKRIDQDTVRKIARLARIEVAADSERALADELATIVSWIEQLNELDTGSVEPLSSVTGHPLPMRDDEVTAGGDADSVLKNAPESVSGFFVVPKVIE